MSKETPLDIVLESDPQQIVFAGANASPLTLTLTNNDTRNATSVLVNAVRGDLLKKNDLTLTPEELTGGGYKVVDEEWVECRLGDPDAWQPIDEWATPFDLGALAAGASVSFELRVNVPAASADVGRMCFAIMISATAGEDLRVLSVVIDQAGWALTTGDTTTATVTVTADVGADDSVNWSSSNSGAATINNAGLITAVAPGTSVIEAVSVVNSLARSSRFVVVSDPVGPPIAGYAAWYDASDAASITESGGAVSAWADLSGNGNHLTQANASLQPATGSETQNGLNVISFDGTEHMALPVGAIPTGTSQYTIFAVWRSDSARGHLLFGGAQNVNQAIGFETISTAIHAYWWGNDHWFYGSVTLTAPMFTAWSWDGSNDTIQVGSGSDVLAMAGKSTDSTAGTVGSLAGSYSLTGFIAELVIYHTALTPAEIAAVESYLKAKWGL